MSEPSLMACSEFLSSSLLERVMRDYRASSLGEDFGMKLLRNRELRNLTISEPEMLTAMRVEAFRKPGERTIENEVAFVALGTSMYYQGQISCRLHSMLAVYSLNAHSPVLKDTAISLACSMGEYMQY